MSNYNLNNLSDHKKEMKTETMKVPAVLHVSDDLMPNDDTLAEIEGVALSPRFRMCIVKKGARTRPERP